jgi:hypothetical protein
MMPLPPVETFETDITEEIKNTQGRVTDVLAAHSNAPARTPNQGIITTIILLIIILTILLSAVIWYYFDQKQKVALLLAKQAEQVQVVGAPLEMSKLLPKTASRIDRLVTKSKKAPSGYIFTITDYSEVYGSLLTNETVLGQEMITLFGLDTKSTPIFKDVTLNNQDIRVATLIIRSTSTPESTVDVPKSTSTAPARVSVFPDGYDPRSLFSTTTTTVVVGTSTSSTTKSTTTKPVATVSTSTKPTSAVSTSTKQATTSRIIIYENFTPPKSTSTNSTSTATSTNSTSTVATSTLPQEEVIDPALLIYVSYGFVGTSTLIISTSPDKFLEVRSGIIK